MCQASENCKQKPGKYARQPIVADAYTRSALPTDLREGKFPRVLQRFAELGRFAAAPLGHVGPAAPLAADDLRRLADDCAGLQTLFYQVVSHPGKQAHL